MKRNKKKILIVLCFLLTIALISKYSWNKYSEYKEAHRIPKLTVYTTENGEVEIETLNDMPNSNIAELTTTSNIIDMKHDKKATAFGIAVEYNGDSVDFIQAPNYIVLPEGKGMYKIMIRYYLDEITYRYEFKVNLI